MRLAMKIFFFNSDIVLRMISVCWYIFETHGPLLCEIKFKAFHLKKKIWTFSLYSWFKSRQFLKEIFWLLFFFLNKLLFALQFLLPQIYYKVESGYFENIGIKKDFELSEHRERQ